MTWPASPARGPVTLAGRGLSPGRRPVVGGRRGTANPEPPPLIELTGVTKVFDPAADQRMAAVAELNLKLAAGSTTLVMGPSGSGKTTLLGLIGCMVRPTAGRIRLTDLEVTRLPEEQLASLRRHWFGFVFQNHHLIRGATALQNVMLPGLPCPELNGDLRHNAEALLERLGMAARGHQRVERLSGGEQQRVAIARALINDPQIVLADEPTAHLDSGAAHDLLGLIGKLREEGKTVVVASHDPVLCASSLFSQRLELREGRLG